MSIKSAQGVTGVPSSSQPLQLSTGAAIQAGQTVRGEIVGTKDGKLLLQLGQSQLLAETSLNLTVGDKLNLMVQGFTEGKLNLKLLNLHRSLFFSQLTMEDLAVQLTALKLPATNDQLSLARSLVEYGLPLNRELLMDLQKVLAQVGVSSPTNSSRESQTQGALFLASSKLPMTPQNVQTMAAFLSQHPQIGDQLFALQGALRKALASDAGTFSILLSQSLHAIAEFILDPTRQTRERMRRRIQQIAGEPLSREAADGEDEASDATLLQFLSSLRKALRSQKSSPWAQDLQDQILEVEENFKAQELINRGEQREKFLYFQLPYTLGGAAHTAHIKIACKEDQHGRRVVDEENTTIEFLTGTEAMGSFSVRLDILRKDLSGKIGTEERVSEFVENRLEMLKEKLMELQYLPSLSVVVEDGLSACVQRGGEMSMERVDFEKIEQVSIMV